VTFPNKKTPLINRNEIKPTRIVKIQRANDLAVKATTTAGRNPRIYWMPKRHKKSNWPFRNIVIQSDRLVRRVVPPKRRPLPKTKVREYMVKAVLRTCRCLVADSCRKLIISIPTFSILLLLVHPPRSIHQQQQPQEDDASLISLSNAQLALETLGVEMTIAELQQQFPHQDYNNDDDDDSTRLFLDSQKFLKVAARQVFQMEQAHQCFQLLDQNDKGVVVLEDLEHVARELGEEWTRDELEEMINVVDRNGHGLLDASDFVRIAKRINL
jgi:calcium-binding protein CML